jgi:hypothetical protein
MAADDCRCRHGKQQGKARTTGWSIVGTPEAFNTHAPDTRIVAKAI